MGNRGNSSGLSLAFSAEQLVKQLQNHLQDVTDEFFRFIEDDSIPSYKKTSVNQIALDRASSIAGLIGYDFSPDGDNDSVVEAKQYLSQKLIDLIANASVTPSNYDEDGKKFSERERHQVMAKRFLTNDELFELSKNVFIPALKSIKNASSIILSKDRPAEDLLFNVNGANNNEYIFGRYYRNHKNWSYEEWQSDPILYWRNKSEKPTGFKKRYVLLK